MTVTSLSQHCVDTPNVKTLYAANVDFCAYRPISRLYRLHIVLNIADAMSCAIFFYSISQFTDSGSTCI
jgi:hypothetical protein